MMKSQASGIQSCNVQPAGRALRSRRRAFTLIETVTALTVMSAIFGTMVLTLHVMQKSSQGLTDGMNVSAQQQRFAMQLRRDARQALSATTSREANDGPAQALELSLADGRSVKYRMSADGIDRHVMSGQSIVHRDSFAVSPVLDNGWAVDTERTAPLVTVHLHRDAGIGTQTNPTLVPLQLVVALQTSHSNEATASASSRP